MEIRMLPSGHQACDNHFSLRELTAERTEKHIIIRADLKINVRNNPSPSRRRGSTSNLKNMDSHLRGNDTNTPIIEENNFQTGLKTTTAEGKKQGETLDTKVRKPRIRYCCQ